MQTSDENKDSILVCKKAEKRLSQETNRIKAMTGLGRPRCKYWGCPGRFQDWWKSLPRKSISARSQVLSAGRGSFQTRRPRQGKIWPVRRRMSQEAHSTPAHTASIDRHNRCCIPVEARPFASDLRECCACSFLGCYCHCLLIPIFTLFHVDRKFFFIFFQFTVKSG